MKNLTEAERWRYHAYDYGFRRVQLGNTEAFYPLDPKGEWFDAHYANVAVAFYRKLLRKPEMKSAPEPTDEDIAHVAARAEEARANIGRYLTRNARAFRNPRQSLEDTQKQLGVIATEQKKHPYQDDGAVRRAAHELGLIATEQKS